MFGDLKDKYLDLFEKNLQDKSLEEFLEEEDITPEECLYLLFLNGYIKDPNEKAISFR